MKQLGEPREETRRRLGRECYITIQANTQSSFASPLNILLVSSQPRFQVIPRCHHLGQLILPLSLFIPPPSPHQQTLSIQQPAMESINSKVILIIAKQIAECVKKSPDCVKVILNEAEITDIQAEITGPVGTPYEGGIYRCKLTIEPDFPNNPPKGYFLTKIFHPNVSEKGEICVNTLKKDWNPQAWSLYNIFQVIKCLLIVPFPESSLNEEAGKLFMEDYKEYFKHAKMINELHAIPKELKKLENNIQKNEQEGESKESKVNEGEKLVMKKQNDKKKWLKRI